jgi:tRNA(Ile)-lysidine synthase
MIIMKGSKQNESVEKRVALFIRRNALVSPGSKVLVAVSGGPDSLTLLHILHRIRTELGINLHVAHLNHGLRGTESEADARYVAELAAKMDLPATIETRDVSAYQAEHRLSPEEAAREVRYGFLAQTAGAIGAAVTAVGHTMNDQVETILLHIIRGTGTRGLRGLQPRSILNFSGLQLTVVRPLLEVSREETETYCTGLQLNPCQDASNYSLSPLRNRVRRELLPLLRTYNPEIFESLLRMARIARDDMAFLEAETIKSGTDTGSLQGDNFIFDKTAFLALAPASQRQLLRKAIDELLGTLKDIETRHIEEILNALKKPAGKQISLPEGLIFSVDYNRYLLGFHPEETVPFPEIPACYEVRIPGTTEIPGWQILATVTSSNSRAGDPVSPECRNHDGFQALFDLEKVGDNLKIRARLPGDVFQPLGMDCPKKVGEFMLDARIPRAWRARVPILFTPQQIIWVAGWRIDDRVKVTGDTKQVLSLMLKKNHLPAIRDLNFGN